ncbi:hypothetical protein NL676_032076 [Syzygium grande]|nr:hypothetical protein NL676_032076 [Syzygium grande]
MSPTLLCTLIFLITIFVTARPQDDASYNDRCRPFACGGITFPFPFSDATTFGTGRYDCGLPRFQVSCDPSGRPVLDLPGTPYRVLALHPDSEERIITVVNDQLVKDLTAGSCESLQNLTVPSSGVEIDNLGLPPLWRVNLTFFECASGTALPRELANSMVVNASCGDAELYLWNTSINPSAPSNYSSLEFANKSNNERWSFVLELMSKGFPLVWSAIPDCDDCELRGGRCGFDAGAGNVVCFCGGGGCGEPDMTKPDKTKLIIGCALGGSSLVLVMTLLFIFKKRSLPIQKTSCFGKDEAAEETANAEQFIRTYQSTLLTNSKSIPMPPKPQFFSPPRAQAVPGSSSTDVDASVLPLTLDSQEM